jgi:hypothetical protein
VKARGWLVTALVAVLGGAFGVQASSTWLLGEHQHIDVGARPFLILLLEVGSITGAALYLATRNAGTRRRAGLLVAIAVGVGATGGVMRYGFLIGLPVAAVLLLMVDIIGRFWHEEEPVEQPERSADGPPSPRDQRDVVAPPSETRPLVESPVTIPMTVRPPAPAPTPAPKVVPPSPAPATVPMDPPSLHAVPRSPGGKRNRDELEAAGRALPDDLRVVRKTGEAVDSLRVRVEAAEAEAEDADRRRTRAYTL